MTALGDGFRSVERPVAEWNRTGAALLLGGVLVRRRFGSRGPAASRPQAGADSLPSEAEILHRAILESVPAGVITCDENGVVESINRAAAAAFGYDSAEVIGQSLSMLLPAARAPEINAAIANYIEANKQRSCSRWHDLLGRRKDGSEFPLAFAIEAVQWPGRRLFVAVVRDTNEQNRFRNVAQRAAARRLRPHAFSSRVAGVTPLDELASGLAHKLTEPLATVLNYIDTAMERIRDGSVRSAKLIRNLEPAVTYAQQTTGFVEHLRHFTSRSVPRRTAVQLNALVHEACKLLQSELQAGGVELRLALSDGLPFAQADPIQTVHVLVNLLRNSLAALTAPGVSGRRIVVATTLVGRAYVSCTVEDSGPGLPVDVRDRVFEPFCTTGRSRRGTGLSDSRAIIESFGGKLSLASAPQRGARFCFTLPTHVGATPDAS